MSRFHEVGRNIKAGERKCDGEDGWQARLQAGTRHADTMARAQRWVPLGKGHYLKPPEPLTV